MSALITCNMISRALVGSWVAMFWYVSGRSLVDSSEVGAERIYADFFGMQLIIFPAFGMA